MVERFNALADRGTLNFEAWFNDRIHDDRNWAVDEENWRFRYRYLPTTRLLGRTQHWPLPLLRTCPDVLVSLYAEPVFVFGWMLARLRGAKTGFRVLKTYDRWVERHPLKDAVKRYMFRRVDAVETPGEDGKQFAIRCGAREDRISLATHTVDIPHFNAGAARTRSERDRLRQAHGLLGPTFIYVGRLWWGKGINFLIDAFELVQRQIDGPISLLILGDGPEEAKLRAECAARGIHNVFFAGFRQKPELPLFYAIADVFVFPTLGDPYGLVVDEAMACSLPIISTSEAGEIRDRVEDGVNGYVVPPEDSVSLANRMLRLALSPALRERMGRVSFEKVAGHTPERWALSFEGIVRTLLTDESLI